jgi:hypothetical protein
MVRCRKNRLAETIEESVVNVGSAASALRKGSVASSSAAYTCTCGGMSRILAAIYDVSR